MELEVEKVGAGQDRSVEGVSEQELAAGAREFELFWLRPSRYAGREANVRLMVNGKLGGWKLKDELVNSLGLKVGDTVNAEVTVLLGPGIISDSDDVDLFADGEAATWLLDTILKAGSAEGCVVDVRVRFTYETAPVGGPEGRSVGKASLVLLEGIRFVECSPKRAARTEDGKNRLLSTLIESLGD